MMPRNFSIPPAASRALQSLPTSVGCNAWKPEPAISPILTQRNATKPAQKADGSVMESSRKIEDFLHLPLQRTRDTNIKSFTYRYRRIHAYSITAQLERESAFGEDRFSRRWNTRTDSLWWNAVAYKSFADKRVVRSYGSRKLRLAFTESLRKKGIAPDGSRLPGSGQDQRPPVFGTAALMPNIEILTTRMKDLVLETDTAVAQILSLQEKSPGHYTPYQGAKGVGFKRKNSSTKARSGSAKAFTSGSGEVKTFKFGSRT